MYNKKNLKIEIPPIDPEIFEKRIIDGIVTKDKEIKQKSSYDFWLDLEKEENESKENPNKKIKTK